MRAQNTPIATGDDLLALFERLLAKMLALQSKKLTPFNVAPLTRRIDETRRALADFCSSSPNLNALDSAYANK